MTPSAAGDLERQRIGQAQWAEQLLQMFERAAFLYLIVVIIWCAGSFGATYSN